MQRTMNWKGLAVVCGVILLVFLVLHGILQSNLRDKQAVSNDKQAALIDLQTENRALLAEMETVGTNAYIENSARMNYSYVQKGEIRFEFTNPEALSAYTEKELQILMDEMAD